MAMENVENTEKAGRMCEALSMFYTFSTAKKRKECFDVEIGRTWRRVVGSRVPRDRVGELSMAMENMKNMERRTSKGGEAARRALHVLHVLHG